MLLSQQLIEIDVVGPKAPQALVDAAQDVHAVGAAAVHVVVAHGESHLGGEDHLVAHALERNPEQALALAAAVDIRGVDQVHASIQGRPHQSAGRGLVKVAHLHAPAELHRSEPHRADDQPRVTQLTVLHVSSSEGRLGGPRAAIKLPLPALLVS